MAPDCYDAVIFDLDGVITDTARVHASAWKILFDDYLAHRAKESDKEFAPFLLEADYLAYVDGKPRYDGVRSFLASRGIELSSGNPADSPGAETVCGLGNRKDGIFRAILQRDGVPVFASTVALVDALRQEDVKVGLASSSKNCDFILRLAGLKGAFTACVDGLVAAELQLPGKPAPETFVETARRLGSVPRRTIIVEDAIAGVEAGRRGQFLLVIGMDRAGWGGRLAAYGADVVVSDLAGVTPQTIDGWCAELQARRERG